MTLYAHQDVQFEWETTHAATAAPHVATDPKIF